MECQGQHTNCTKCLALIERASKKGTSPKETHYSTIKASSISAVTSSVSGTFTLTYNGPVTIGGHAPFGLGFSKSLQEHLSTPIEFNEEAWEALEAYEHHKNKSSPGALGALYGDQLDKILEEANLKVEAKTYDKESS